MSKIFVVGVQRTGTTSVGQALELLGISVKPFDAGLLQLGHRMEYAELLHIVKTAPYQAFRDSPWRNTDVVRYLAANLPDAKFILTLRDETAWARSHQDWMGPRNLGGYYAVCDQPRYNATKAVADFRWVQKRIRETFADQPERLLELWPCEGEGWEKLCPFLGLPTPDVPFPDTNKAPRLTYYEPPAQVRSAKAIAIATVVPVVNESHIEQVRRWATMVRQSVTASVDNLGEFVVVYSQPSQRLATMAELAFKSQGIRAVPVPNNGMHDMSALEDMSLIAATGDYVLRLDLSDRFTRPVDLSDDISFMEANPDFLYMMYGPTYEDGLPIYEDKPWAEANKAGVIYRRGAQLRHKARFQRTFPRFSMDHPLTPDEAIPMVMLTTPWRAACYVVPPVTC